MAEQQSKNAVGVFVDRDRTQAALDLLTAAEFPTDGVSVVTKHVDEEDRTLAATAPIVESQTQFESQQTTGRIGKGVLAGGGLGSAAGLLLSGLAIVAVPGLGSLAVAGVGLATGAFYGALSGGLINTGIANEISADRIKPYIDKLTAGRYLLVIKGTDDELARAGAILQDSGVEDWQIFEPV
jgi:uncharacterized membrane protein